MLVGWCRIGQTRGVRHADTAIISSKLVCGILSPISWVRLLARHSPANGNSPGLSSDLIEGLWRWLMRWGLEHPSTLTWVGRATTQHRNVRMSSIYISIVVVSRNVNLWCNYTTVLIPRSFGRYVGSWSRLPDHLRVRYPSWSYDLIYDIVQVWPDSYQERNAFIPHLHEHDNLGETGQSLQWAFCTDLRSACMQTIRNVRCKAHC